MTTYAKMLTKGNMKDEVAAKILERLERLEFLVRTGGKDSRVVEYVPSWTEDQCDATCDLTGATFPKGHARRVGKLSVHPGVYAYAQEHGIEEVDLDVEIPDDYLVVPTTVRFRQRYEPPVHLEWDVADLPKVNRPGLMFLANKLGLVAALDAAGYEDQDFRRQSNEWLRTAILAITEGKKPPKPQEAGVRQKSKPAPKEEKPEPEAKKDEEKTKPKPRKPKKGKDTAPKKTKKKTAKKKSSKKKTAKKKAKKAKK